MADPPKKVSRGRKPVMQCTQGEWREACRKMKASVPPPNGFVWRFMWTTSLPEGEAGDCVRREGEPPRPGTITIKVARGMSYSETVDTLIHEVAHAFDMWTHHSWSTDHGDTFWIWMGRIFRRYWGVD